MLFWMLALGGALTVLAAITLLIDRRADRTVIERMESSDHRDGQTDPRAYIDTSG